MECFWRPEAVRIADRGGSTLLPGWWAHRSLSTATRAFNDVTPHQLGQTSVSYARGMTIQWMDHVGVVVDDLEAAT